MTTTTSPRRFASPGAVAQHGGQLPVRTCDRCGADIVFVKSNRTGGFYPVTVSRRTNQNGPDFLFYIGNNIHPRDCADTKAAKDADERRSDLIRAAREQMDATIDALMVGRSFEDIDRRRHMNNLAVCNAAFIAYKNAINDGRYDR